MRHQFRGGTHENERELRRRMTDAERLVWAALRSRRLAGRKFRRQYRVENMILDFYCPELRIALELDGEGHFSEAGRARDARRDEQLRALGIMVIRHENREVVANPEVFSQELARICVGREAALHPAV